MRELKEEELHLVTGGNLTYFTSHGLAAYQAFQGGYSIGRSINNFNERTFGMSFGDALYKTFN